MTRTTTHDDTPRDPAEAVPAKLRALVDLADANGQGRIKPARNLIEYTSTDPWPDGIGAELTAWHARERLHCCHGPAVCYVDPDADRADVLTYLADVVRAVSTTPEWPPRASMSTTGGWPHRTGKRRVGVMVNNPYTGSRIDLSLHEKDATASPAAVLDAMRADLGTAATESAKPVQRTVEYGKHRLVLDLRSGRHFDALADALAKACEQYATVTAVVAGTDDTPF